MTPTLQSTSKYVVEQAVRITESNLRSIGDSIANERSKAGVLLGFVLLIATQGIEYIDTMPSILKWICLFAVGTAAFRLVFAFRSERVGAGISVEYSFAHDWKQYGEDLEIRYNEFFLDSLVSNCRD